MKILSVIAAKICIVSGCTTCHGISNVFNVLSEANQLRNLNWNFTDHKKLLFLVTYSNNYRANGYIPRYIHHVFVTTV